MYIIKNALENLGRNKGRNILISIIIFAIICTTVVALCINNTAGTVIDDYKNRFGSEVTITPDFQKVQQDAMKNSTNGRVMMKMPQIPPEQALAFAKSDTLQKSVAYGSIGANDDSIKAIDQDTSDNGNNGNNASSSGGQGMVAIKGSNGNYQVFGDYWQDFTDGSRTLVDDGVSKMPAIDSECLVSKDLADLNNIKVGDTLTFTSEMAVDIPSSVDVTGKKDGDTVTINNTEYKLSSRPDGSFGASRDINYSLKVTGIYNDLNDEYPNPNMPQIAGLNRRNEVLTTLNTLLNLRKTDENNIRLNVTYYLKSPDLLPQFESYVRSQGLSDLFNVSADTASYNQVVKPVEALKGISITFMIIVLVLGAIILILLTSIAIRERKYEIGVLRAMGMKKGKVALGLWTELLSLTIACLIIGISVGGLAAQPVTNVLLTQQVQAIQNDSNNQPGGMTTAGAGGQVMTIQKSGAGGMTLGGNQSNAKPLSEMKITIGSDTILEIIAIALLLCSIAGLFSIIKITKYEPIKILMERN